jgi:preprotein translocase subunit SecD
MTDIETRATEARRKAQGEIALVEVPEAETVMGERRRRHALRNGITAVVIVAVLGVGVGAIVASSGGDPTPKPDVAVAPVGDRATLQFREMQNEFDCDRGRPSTAPVVEVVPDAKNEKCYVLGPALMDGMSLADVEATVNPEIAAYELQLQFSNDDFAAKVGGPMVGKQVAIVVDDIVYSAPMINAGITGRSVHVTGDFDRQQIRELAAALRGVDVSQVEDPCPKCSR